MARTELKLDSKTTLVKPSTWAEVVTAAAAGAPLYYQAPFDHVPIRVFAGLKLHRKGLRINASTLGVDAFWANKDHLDRFWLEDTSGESNESIER